MMEPFKYTKRGTAFYHVLAGGPEKTLCTDMVSSPRYSVRTTMPSLYIIQKFLRFPSYKISITLLLIFICLGKSHLKLNANIVNFRDIQ